MVARGDGRQLSGLGAAPVRRGFATRPAGTCFCDRLTAEWTELHPPVSRSASSCTIRTCRSSPRPWRRSPPRWPRSRDGELGDVAVTVVDNGSPDAGALDRVVASALPADRGSSVAIRRGHGNVGYGRGHNIAIAPSTMTYHLILNPDAILEPAALSGVPPLPRAPTPMSACWRPTSGAAPASASTSAGAIPACLVLLLRGFAPPWIKRRLHAACSSATSCATGWMPKSCATSRSPAAASCSRAGTSSRRSADSRRSTSCTSRTTT